MEWLGDTPMNEMNAREYAEHRWPHFATDPDHARAITTFMHGVEWQAEVIAKARAWHDKYAMFLPDLPHAELLTILSAASQSAAEPDMRLNVDLPIRLSARFAISGDDLVLEAKRALEAAAAVIAEADERLHAASIPLGMSELAFAQATIRDVHSILSASRDTRRPSAEVVEAYNTGFDRAAAAVTGLNDLTEEQGVRLLHAVRDMERNEEYTDAVVEDLAVYFMDYHDPRGWPIGQTIRNRYQAIKDGSPVRDRFPEQYDAEEGAK